MTIKKQLLIKQTVLILLALIVGWPLGILMSFFFLPVMALYFLRKDNFVKLGKPLRILIYFFIILIFWVLLMISIDFDPWLITEGLVGVTWRNIWWILYYSFSFETESIWFIVYGLVVAGLLWWAGRVNKSFHKLNER